MRVVEHEVIKCKFSVVGGESVVNCNINGANDGFQKAVQNEDVYSALS